MARGYSDIYEKEYNRKDGVIIPVELRTYLIRDKNNNPCGMWATVRDISDRKRAEEALQQSEEKYRLLVENQTDLIIKMDSKYRFQFVSPSYCEYFGKTEKELLQHDFLSVIHSEDQDTMLKGMKTLYTPPYTYSVEQHVQIEDGWRWLAWAYKAVLNKKGKVIAIVGVGRDITERKRLEQQLLQAQKMEAVGRLAGGVAHDFNNLLTAIIGNSEMLLADIGSGNRIYEDIEEIKKAADRAASLTRQLLAFSRRQALSPQLVNLNTIILHMQKMLSRIIGENIELITQLEPGLHGIKADPGQIEQVIMNLIVNAYDAMPEGGQLTIQTENVSLDIPASKTIPYSRPGKFVCLSIKDTGIGMDAKILSQIFEPFFSTKSVGRGTGLGLAVVYGIIKQHDGWINVYSELKKGSIFKIFLPAYREKIKKNSTRNQSIKKLKGKGERVLIVEDEEVVRNFVSRALRENNYEICEAKNAEQAIKIFLEEKFKFDLLFTDIVLPDSTGFQLIEKLLTLKPELKVLLSSGYTDHNSQSNLIQEKGFRLLQKPFVLFELLRNVREIFQS